LADSVFFWSVYQCVTIDHSLVWKWMCVVVYINILQRFVV